MNWPLLPVCGSVSRPIMKTTTLARLLLIALLCPVSFVAGQSGTRTLQFPLPPHRDAIGTQIAPANRSHPTIGTYIREVTLSELRRIQRAGLEYFEVTGLIDGIGWGGAGIFGRLESHYTYRVPYVLRVPIGWTGTLVVFRHPNSGFLNWKQAEASLGTRNIGRHFHEYSDWLVSDVALHPTRKWAFFAINYTPFALDGRPSLFSLPGSDDDNDGRVDEDPGQDDDNDGLDDEDGPDNIDNDLDGRVDEDQAVDDDRDGRLNEDPGRTAIMAQGDVTISRDTVLLAKHLLKVIAGKSVTVTLGTGHATGAAFHSALNTGIEPVRISGRQIRSGDNYVVAYDPSSAKIFDGLLAFSGGGATIDGATGISVPTMFVSGEADSAAVGVVQHVKQMVDLGLDVSSLARIYMTRGVPTIDSDFVRGDHRCGFDCTGMQWTRGGGVRWKPLSAALLDALWRWVVHGTSPPQSIFNGTPVDLNGDGAVDSLRFPLSTRSGPSFGFSFPYVDDPSLDQAAPPTAITNTQNNTAFATLWASVQQSLRAQVDSVFLPEIACRRGRYSLIVQGPMGATFVPFDQQTFTAWWGSSAAHQTCRVQVVDALVAKGLYDPTVVTIDIRPDVFPNPIDTRNQDLIPVAIFSTRGFDATHINAASLRLGGARPARDDGGDVRDVNGDGRDDLVVHFPARDVSLVRPGDLVVDLEGRTWSGVPFSGTDVVEFVN